MLPERKLKPNMQLFYLKASYINRSNYCANYINNTG